MSEPSRPRPVPGPLPGAAPRPAPTGSPAEPMATEPTVTGAADTSTGPAAFADLDRRPVTEHVDVFEAEHARLERELRTIDQL